MAGRLALALAAGHVTSAIGRRLGRGSTVLPGHVVARLDPHALEQLSARIPCGVALISGTNGKTTTARMVSQAATLAGLRPIANRSGANLPSGILTAAATHASILGRSSGDIAILEVDEAHLPAIVHSTRPRLLALTNLFRDQLDRYGETDLITSTWRAAIAQLDASATLILNVDDPAVAMLQESAPGKVVSYGIDDETVGRANLPHEADVRLCPRCDARLRYSCSYYGHIGHYGCESCGWRRPTPDIRATSVFIEPGGSTTMNVESNGQVMELAVPLPGLYNAYNALAALTISQQLGIPDALARDAIQQSTAVFGRQERIKVGEGEITLALVKNPVGFNQVLQALSYAERSDLVIIAINDLFADGTDVSWLWDVDFEVLADRSESLLCAGLRAEDLALRLKYANIDANRVHVEHQLARAVRTALEAAQGGQFVTVFPTYTAMFSLRAELQSKGVVAPFWDQ